MIETASSAFERRLAKAVELFERGKQRQAVQELWLAEALARGDEDAIREMLELTRGLEQRIEPKQESRLAELVVVLERDAGSARSPCSPALLLAPAEAEPVGRI